MFLVCEYVKLSRLTLIIIFVAITDFFFKLSTTRAG